jgi:hypothetical protein
VDDSTGPHTWPWAGKSSRVRQQLRLAATAQAPGLARQATHEALAAWRVAHLEETAVLLVSEAAGGWLRIEVHDADPRMPQPRTPDMLDGSGFGFVLLDALADKWGVRESTIGKAVWAELDTRQGGKPEA